MIATWQDSESSVSSIFGNLAYNFVIGFFPLGPVTFGVSNEIWVVDGVQGEFNGVWYEVSELLFHFA